MVPPMPLPRPTLGGLLSQTQPPCPLEAAAVHLPFAQQPGFSQFPPRTSLSTVQRACTTQAGHQYLEIGAGLLLPPRAHSVLLHGQQRLFASCKRVSTGSLKSGCGGPGEVGRQACPSPMAQDRLPAQQLPVPLPLLDIHVREGWT